MVGALWLPAFGAEGRELKDAAGNAIIRYVAETLTGTWVLFLCVPEHDRPAADEILPVREALERKGCGTSTCSSPGIRRAGSLGRRIMSRFRS